MYRNEPALCVCEFDLATMSEARAAVYAAATEAGASLTDAQAFMTSVAEIMNNAIEHGGGGGQVSVWCDAAAGLVGEVHDAGRAEPFTVPTAPPPADRLGGRGLWLASQLCDRVTIRTSRAGTSLTLELALTA